MRSLSFEPLDTSVVNYSTDYILVFHEIAVFRMQTVCDGILCTYAGLPGCKKEENLFLLNDAIAGGNDDAMPMTMMILWTYKMHCSVANVQFTCTMFIKPLPFYLHKKGNTFDFNFHSNL